MKGKLTWPIFWALVGVLIVAVSVVFIFGDLLKGPPFIIVSGAIFLLLAVALIYLTVKEKVGGMLKWFLLLTGASAIGIPVSIFLHNAISALFGIEEPVFFIIAIFVCPIAFLVGAVGSIVLAIKKYRMAK